MQQNNQIYKTSFMYEKICHQDFETRLQDDYWGKVILIIILIAFKKVSLVGYIVVVVDELICIVLSSSSYFFATQTCTNCLLNKKKHVKFIGPK